MNKTETVLEIWKTNLWLWKGKHGGGIIQELGMNIYTLQEDSPGGGHGKTQPSILAWKIPWTEKHSGLQSMGAHRVGHDRSNSARMHTYLLFSRWVVSDSLQRHGLQHARLPCPSPSPGVYSNLFPLSQWCHSTILSSVVPFSSCLQSFPASGSFLMSQLFAPGSQSIGVWASASVLPMNIQGWFPLGWTGLISLESRGLSHIYKTDNQQDILYSTGTLLSILW